MSREPCFRTAVVVNPNSSNGRTGQRWPAIEKQLRAHLGDAMDVLRTSAPGDATQLTRKALESGAEMVVSVGGDGTNNEVVNGFFRGDGTPVRPDAVFGVLPSATGGDFRKSLGQGTDLAANAAVLAGRATRTIDVGRASFVGHDGETRTRYFVNITSFGVGGVVDDYVNRSSKALGGKASFFMAALRAFITYKNRRITLRLDDGEPQELRINNVSVANGQFFGGGMWVAPEARLDDGLFDVVTFGDLTKLEYMRLAGSIYKGNHLGRAKIEHGRARVVEAHSDEIVLIDMDGEQPGKLPIRLEIVPGALRVKVATSQDGD